MNQYPEWYEHIARYFPIFFIIGFAIIFCVYIYAELNKPVEKKEEGNNRLGQEQVCACAQGIVKYDFSRPAFKEACAFFNNDQISAILLAKKAKEYLVQKAEPKIREVLNTSPDATLEQLKKYFANTDIVIVDYERVESPRKARQGYIGESR